MTILQNLEEAVRKVAESDTYRRRLESDIRNALRNYDAQDALEVKPLTSINSYDPLKDYHFALHDRFTNSNVGYIFPFRRVAITDNISFLDALNKLLSPQDYEVLRYTYHRPMNLGNILHLLTRDDFGGHLERLQEAQIRLLW